MKRILAVSFSLLAAGAFAAGPTCKWSNVEKLKEHLKTHVTYPASGKAVKETCKKEMPDEFTTDERACAEKKLADGTEYKSADEVLKALGVK